MYRNRQPGVERRPFSLFVTAFPERFLIQGGVLCGNDGVGECLFRVAAASVCGQLDQQIRRGMEQAITALC